MAKRKPFGVVQCANCATDVIRYKRYDDRRGDPEVYCRDCNKKKPARRKKVAAKPKPVARIPQPGDICAVCGATLVWDSFDQRGVHPFESNHPPMVSNPPLTASQRKILLIMQTDPTAIIWHGYDRSSGKPYLVADSVDQPIGLQYRTLDALVDAGYLVEVEDWNNPDVEYRWTGKR